MTTTQDLKPQDVINFLRAIETGEVKIVPVNGCPQKVYASDIEYRCTTKGEYKGWRLVVFNDCNQWDYVDSISTDGGKTWLAFWGEDKSPKHLRRWRHIQRYQPRPAVAWSAYRIPGYLTTRCEKCNAYLINGRPGKVVKNRYLCPVCAGLQSPRKPKTVAEKLYAKAGIWDSSPRGWMNRESITDLEAMVEMIVDEQKLKEEKRS